MSPRKFIALFCLTIGIVFNLAACNRRLSQVQAVVRNSGSDTMVNLAQAWAEQYSHEFPSVSVEVSGGGSATGIVSLIEGSADLANCSRQMEPEEVDAVRRKTGSEPREWLVGLDALAVYVNASNPLESITLQQLADVYGRHGRTTSWRSLGVSIPGAKSDEIILISRQSNSGTYQYFRQSILGSRGDFRQGTRDLNGSKEVVSLIGGTPGTIGYSGMGYVIPQVKMLKVARRPGETAYPPTVANTLSGAYPLSRPLYIYTRSQLSKPVQIYLDWIRSTAGQKVVELAGYVPVSHTAVDLVRTKLEKP
ncbi:MAG: PstS family phosphate ABC transporter substrate-binding protein [Bryobacteraceae bacterium]